MIKAIATSSFALTLAAAASFAAESAHVRSNTLSVILKHDRVEELLEDDRGPDGQELPIVSRLADMEKLGLLSGQTAKQPWSDSYWPLYKGGVAARYATPEFASASSTDWRDFERLGDQAIATDDLSPVEKYELVTGLERHPITKSMWDTAASYQKKYGEVESWIGLCNGWAYASGRLPRPRKSIELRAQGPSGHELKVTFYPSDIKALGSFLWSRRDLPFRFVGRRCTQKNPPLGANGRIDGKYADCIDTNPATWHEALVNQVGVRAKSFVFDASYDYEIWNYPVRSYRYTYFNPATGRSADTLAAAQSPVGFDGDRYASYRAPNATSVVGIAMDVTFVDEIDPPTHRRSDSESDDRLTTVHYVYDLELGSRGQLVGGEWHQQAHPDFLWTIPSATVVTSAGDSLVTEPWNGRGLVPQSWSAAAEKAADKGELLPAFVDLIFDLSR